MAEELPDVKCGQVWADNDWRSEGRTLLVLAIRDNGKALCRVLSDRNNRPKGARTQAGRETLIAIRRFKPTSTGYRLLNTSDAKALDGIDETVAQLTDEHIEDRLRETLRTAPLNIENVLRERTIAHWRIHLLRFFHPGVYPNMGPEEVVRQVNLALAGVWHSASTAVYRGSDVEAWIKRWREKFSGLCPSDGSVWHVLDDMLDEYRLAADTGEPLKPEEEL